MEFEIWIRNIIQSTQKAFFYASIVEQRYLSPSIR